MTDIVFNEAEHTYTMDGVRVPGVSSLIEMVNEELRFVKREDLERARVLGTKVHRTIEMFERGTLDEKQLHPFLAAHLKQWKTFKSDLRYVTIHTEQIVHSVQHRYCGTMDSFGELNEAPFLPDIKTGGKYRVHKLQTAGYKIAGVEMGLIPQDTRRGSIYLSEDSYELVFHPRDVLDVPAFISCLTLNRWKLES